jgi:hypothetical protein
MYYFTIITGVVTLFGFLIQVFGYLPRLGDFRQHLAIFSLGVCLGSIVGELNPSKLSLDFALTGFTVIVLVFILVIVAFLIIPIFTHDAGRRAEYYAVAGIGFFVFIFVLMFGSASGTKHEATADTVMQSLTIGDLNALVSYDLGRQDFDMALVRLDAMKELMPGSDERLKVVNERIQQVRARQLQ